MKVEYRIIESGFNHSKEFHIQQNINNEGWEYTFTYGNQCWDDLETAKNIVNMLKKTKVKIING